jgi:hypothetical protein
MKVDNQQSSSKNIEDKKLEALRKLLGEPVFIGFSDYVLKLRRNLVAIAIFIIFYKWTNSEISIILGLDCRNIPRTKIEIFLAIYLFYSLLYFLSEASGTYLRWKIRLSGTFKALNQPRDDNKAFANSDILEAIQLKDIGYCYGEQSYLFSVIAQAAYANLNNLTGPKRAVMIQANLRKVLLKNENV